MNREWIVSDTAKADIRNQVIWYESDESHGGDALADRWQEQLELALAKLAAGPERHGMAPENGRWNKSMVIRQMLFRPWKSRAGWRVLYTID